MSDMNDKDKGNIFFALFALLGIAVVAANTPGSFVKNIVIWWVVFLTLMYFWNDGIGPYAGAIQFLNCTWALYGIGKFIYIMNKDDDEPKIEE